MLGLMSTDISNLLNLALHGKISFIDGKSAAVNLFDHYLDQLRIRHCKKQWSQEYKSGVAFRRDSFFSSSAELTQFCRVSLFLAQEQISRLVKEIEAINADDLDVALMNTTIVDYIFDLKQVIEHLERAKTPDFVLFSGGKNYQAESFELFRLSSALLIGQLDKGAHKTRQIAAVCVLRQSLESRFQRIIGVELHDKDGKGPKVRHGFYYKFIADNQDEVELRDCNLKAISSVYDWCNDIVHGAYQPLSWQLPFAHQVCAPLFFSGKSDDGNRWSVYGAARIRNLESMRQSFLGYFAGAYDNGIWCSECLNPEALVG